MRFSDWCSDLCSSDLDAPVANPKLEICGVYQWKRRGEFHLMNPDSIHLLQLSTRTGNYNIFKKYTRVVNEQEKKACTLRSRLHFKPGTPVPLEEVEPVENILKRFATGAMSLDRKSVVWGKSVSVRVEHGGR